MFEIKSILGDRFNVNGNITDQVNISFYIPENEEVVLILITPKCTSNGSIQLSVSKKDLLALFE